MEEYFDKFTLVTQNIDGHHIRAGSKRVLEIHGNLFRNRCNNCGRIWNDETIEFDASFHICKSCGKERVVRPDVVWFGESLPYEMLQQAIDDSQNADLFIVAGTSAQVYPAAELPLIAARHKAFVIELNIETTDLSNFFDHHLIGETGSTLPKLLELIKTAKHSAKYQ
jgi:NAD-dependent deacetylase